MSVKKDITSSEKKMWNYIENLVLREDFKKDIKQFRKEFGIESIS